MSRGYHSRVAEGRWSQESPARRFALVICAGVNRCGSVRAKQNYAYVSLFGISGPHELIQAIYLNTIPTKTLAQPLADVFSRASSDDALASSTGNGTVAPGGSTRLASLRQSNQAPARGTRKWQLRRCINRWSAPMPQPNDLSRSLVALDQNSTIIAVVELSQSSWLVGGVVPGIERQPCKSWTRARNGCLRARRGPYPRP
jgi:hypothetical protein